MSICILFHSTRWRLSLLLLSPRRGAKLECTRPHAELMGSDNRFQRQALLLLLGLNTRMAPKATTEPVPITTKSGNRSALAGTP